MPRLILPILPLLLAGCATFTAASNQTLLEEIIDMNADVQAVGSEGVPADVLSRADEIEDEARALGRLSTAASQANAVGEQDRNEIALRLESTPYRATIETAGTVMGALRNIAAINLKLEELIFDGRQAEALASLVLDQSIDLLTQSLGSLVSGPFAPLVTIAGMGVGALLEAIFGDTEERIEQYTELRDQQVINLVQQTQVLATRTRSQANDMTDFVNTLSDQSRTAYYAELSLIEARDRANMSELRAPQIMPMPTTAEEVAALAVRNESRARLLQNNLQDELSGFYVPPSEEDIQRQGIADRNQARAFAERQARADAFLRARAFMNEMYADIWWTSRFFERQMEALAAVRDRPTMVERDDPNRSGETVQMTATRALVEDEQRMIALHSEMSQIHAGYAGTTCAGIQ